MMLQGDGGGCELAGFTGGEPLVDWQQGLHLLSSAFTSCLHLAGTGLELEHV
jgi:hypothetical protein